MGSPASCLPAVSQSRCKRKPAASLPPAQRSAMTNGSLFSSTIRDGRSGWSRRMKDLLSLYISHLGGEDHVTEAERSMARRIATTTVELEWLELGFAQSPKGPTAEQFDMYLRGSNSLRRYLESIGLKRVARNVTPTLKAYLDDQTDVIEDAEATE